MMAMFETSLTPKRTMACFTVETSVNPLKKDELECFSKEVVNAWSLIISFSINLMSGTSFEISFWIRSAVELKGGSFTLSESK